jgi:ferredoxin-type protein NapG
MSDKPENGTSPLDRRRFLAGILKGACGAGIATLGLSALAGNAATGRAAAALRPPGALAEDDFLAACARCGLCVQACPYDTLKLADLVDRAALGTPYFTAREIPCEMCEDIPCVVACPTGALDPALTDITQAEMGVAVLTGTETCLNLLGLRCDVCYRVCPLIDEAITLETRHNTRTDRHAILAPTVHADLCTGCGKCEKACVLEEAAIRVLPRDQALGKIGDHYRLGWEEKRKHGEALIQDIIDLPDRGYDGTATPPSPVREFTPGGGLKGFKP